MKTALYLFLNIFLTFFEIQRCVYPLVNRYSKTNSCENQKNTALVEQFFNIIFTEFRDPPPICVCVQMCTAQATYCYPNGCLKRTENNEVTTVNPVNRIQYGSTKSVMFLVDDKQDFDEIFESPKLNSIADKNKMPQVNEVVYTQNPYKELFLKYKKLPKLEIRYNLREQVRNTNAAKLKRDKLDMLKTRWPINMHFLKGKQLYNKIYKKNNGIRQSKFFISMMPDTDSVIETPTYYKKLITKREDASVNVEALYLYETDVANFSLETLIDNLIVGSLDRNEDKKNEIENSTKESIIPTTEKIRRIDVNVTKNHLNLRNVKKVNNNSDKTKINETVKMNSTNQYINANNNLMVTEKLNQSSYFEIMTTMAKQIDKQNNMTIELVKRLTKNQKFEDRNKNNASITSTLQHTKSKSNYLNVTENTLAVTNVKVIESQSTTYPTSTKRFTVPELKTSMKKSNKKRIVRKLF